MGERRGRRRGRECADQDQGEARGETAREAALSHGAVDAGGVSRHFSLAAGGGPRGSAPAGLRAGWKEAGGPRGGGAAGGRPDRGDVSLHEPPRPGQLEAREIGGARVDRVLSPDERRLDLVLGALELLRRDGLAPDQLDLREQGLLERLRRLTRKRGRVEPE